MDANKLKLITIRDAERTLAEGDTSLYVLNRSNRQGNINMTVSNGHGGYLGLTIPITHIPMDLSTQAAKRLVLEAPEFRRVYSMGFIKIVDSNDADVFFDNSDKARKERTRLLSNGTGSVNIDDSTDTIVDKVSKDQSVSGEIPNNINVFAVGLVQRSNSGDEESDALLQELETKIDGLSGEDLQYIISNSTDAGLKATASEWLQARG